MTVPSFNLNHSDETEVNNAREVVRRPPLAPPDGAREEELVDARIGTSLIEGENIRVSARIR